MEDRFVRLERIVTELAGAVGKFKDSVEEAFRATAGQIKQLADEGKATNARLDRLVQAVDRYVSDARNGHDKGGPDE